jgi:hypothetical protein
LIGEKFNSWRRRIGPPPPLVDEQVFTTVGGVWATSQPAKNPGLAVFDP